MHKNVYCFVCITRNEVCGIARECNVATIGGNRDSVLVDRVITLRSTRRNTYALCGTSITIVNEYINTVIGVLEDQVCGMARKRYDTPIRGDGDALHSA